MPWLRAVGPAGKLGSGQVQRRQALASAEPPIREHSEGDVAMPTYEYHCRKCGEIFDRFERMKEHEDAHPRCPKCNSRAVEQVFTAFTAKTAKKS